MADAVAEVRGDKGRMWGLRGCPRTGLRTYNTSAVVYPHAGLCLVVIEAETAEAERIRRSKRGSARAIVKPLESRWWW
jgi:hypothetical protein